MAVTLRGLSFTRRLAVVTLLTCGCRGDLSFPVDPGKVPSAPMFGHGGLGGTVIQTPLESDVSASDTVFTLNCLGTDAFESALVSGMKSESDLNCTSKDVVVGSATIHKYQLRGESFTDYTGQPITCPSGSTIALSVSLELSQVANSPRTDIGLWIAQDDGTALTGRCAHYTLATGTTNVDGDECGDLIPDVTVQAGRATAELTCDSLRDGIAHIGACVGWSEPDSNRACSLSPIEQSHYGTLPANKAKCNCSGFDVAINIAP